MSLDFFFSAFHKTFMGTYKIRFDFDFYLQSHAGLQGTVKPTHYTVVYDENNFSADDIQQGTNNINHLYARATKAVSLIPPAYYADLACERGRYYLNEIMANNSSQSAGKRKLTDEEKRKALQAAQKAWGQGVSLRFFFAGLGQLFDLSL